MICWVLLSPGELFETEKTSNLVGAMLDVLGHESIYVLIFKGH